MMRKNGQMKSLRVRSTVAQVSVAIANGTYLLFTDFGPQMQVIRWLLLFKQARSRLIGEEMDPYGRLSVERVLQILQLDGW